MFSGHNRNNDTAFENSISGYGPDKRGVWGGNPGGQVDDRSKYTGGWRTIGEGDGAITIPDDEARYQREAVTRLPSAREVDVNRYRGMGADMANRPAYKLNYGRANALFAKGTQATGLAYGDRANADRSRDYQSEALNLQRGAALGEAPSRAEILGRGMIDQSLKAQVAGAASARGGPLAQMAAQRGAAQGAAAFQAQGANQLSALRADEMERARQGYSSASTAQRGQDYFGADQAIRLGQAYGDFGKSYAGQTEAQGRMEMGQRELNQTGQLDYERLGWDTNNAAANIDLQRAGLEQGQYQFGQTMQQQDADRTMRYVGAAAGAAGALGSAGINAAGRGGGGDDYSDMRAKTPAPLLLSTGKQPKAANPNWLDQFMSPEKAQAKARLQQEEHEDRLDDRRMPEVWDGKSTPDTQFNPPNIDREDPYSPPTPGGIQREDPYGSGEMFYSDPAAKKKAFNEGLTYGQGELYWGSKGQPNQEKLPDYMQKTRSPVPQGQDRALTVEGPATATSIDPKARGERPPPSPNVGDRATEQGAPRPQMTGIPANKDVTGKKSAGGPLASIQQDANRRGAGFPYAYKDQYRPESQAPGELNYGFSAQELEKNPITATAVKRDPDGMRYIDSDKLLKTNTAGIASLQHQLDQLQYGGRRG